MGGGREGRDLPRVEREGKRLAYREEEGEGIIRSGGGR